MFEQWQHISENCNTHVFSAAHFCWIILLSWLVNLFLVCTQIFFYGSLIYFGTGPHVDAQLSPFSVGPTVARGVLSVILVLSCINVLSTLVWFNIFFVVSVFIYKAFVRLNSRFKEAFLQGKNTKPSLKNLRQSYNKLCDFVNLVDSTFNSMMAVWYSAGVIQLSFTGYILMTTSCLDGLISFMYVTSFVVHYVLPVVVLSCASDMIVTEVSQTLSLLL